MPAVLLSVCLEHRRAALRSVLDYECENGSQLMDFEVRQLVDRQWRGCRDASR